MKNLHLLIAASLVNLVFIIGIISLARPAKLEERSGVKEVLVPIAPTQPNLEVAPARPAKLEERSGVVTVTPSPKTPNVAPTTSNPAPIASCIVSVDGVRYDVTQFRVIHSGGDIFKCGTDMSVEFWGQHNAGILAQMARYKI